MSVFASIASLALRPVLDGLAQSFGFGVGEKTVDAVANFFVERLSDQSARLVLEAINPAPSHAASAIAGGRAITQRAAA